MNEKTQSKVLSVLAVVLLILPVIGFALSKPARNAGAQYLHSTPALKWDSEVVADFHRRAFVPLVVCAGLWFAGMICFTILRIREDERPRWHIPFMIGSTMLTVILTFYKTFGLH